MQLGHCVLFLLFVQTAAVLPLCKESDYHFEYTQCDVLGSRWRVAVPNKPGTCTGLPDPVKGTQCTFTCNDGEFLDMRSQQCNKCAAGTFSLGTGVAFDEWDTLPPGFVTHGVLTNEGDSPTDCSNSTWTPKGDHIASNIDECTVSLSYAVNLKKSGVLSFEYFYPDASIYFEFFVQSDQCQSTDSGSRWMMTSENKWSKYTSELGTGNNVLYWRTTSFALKGSAVKPVLLRNIEVSGVAYTSECFHCKPGTYSAKAGSARCTPCPADTFSHKGATVCYTCEKDKYALAGSGSCKPRPACTNSDYFYTHTPCDSQGKTQLMYKWAEPKICNETLKGSVKLPTSGKKQSCPPCNPGFFVTNSSTCEPCTEGYFSNGTVCSKCPVGSESEVGFEYKWWNRMPDNMKSAIFLQGLINDENSTAWEVAGDYIYTTAGELDTDYMMLTFTVPGYRLPHSVVKDNELNPLSRITFVFETQCTADCRLYFLSGNNQWYSDDVEQWKGSQQKQSYSYQITNNNTLSFSWAFQRTEQFHMNRKYSADFARIYSIQISNVIGGVASQCRRCALTSIGAGAECVSCPGGQYMVNGTGVCIQCPKNTFIRAGQAVGKDACIQCGPNTNTNQVRSACLSDCTLTMRSIDGLLLHYDFSPLSNITDIQSSPRFTSKGLQYFSHFRMALCGTEGRMRASCADNVTESGREVKGYVCQSTVVPSGIRSQSRVSSQPFLIGDSLIGVTTELKLDGISSPSTLFPSMHGLPDVIFYYRSSDVTQACKQGRAATIRLRCNPTVTIKDHIILPSNCSEGTCDGCNFHFLWESQHACPLCTKNHYREIVSACIEGIQKTTYVWQQPVNCFGGEKLPPQTVSACVSLDFWLKFGVMIGSMMAVLLVTISCYFWKKTRKLQYKYSRLKMTSGGKECELPAADSCAIMEGDDTEEDLMDLSKKSFFTKIRTFSRERTSDGFDSVPLNTSSRHFRHDEDTDEDEIRG